MKKMYAVLSIVVLVCLSLIFAIDRVRLNYELSKSDAKKMERESCWMEREKEADAQLEKQTKEINQLKRRFRVVGDVTELQELEVALLKRKSAAESSSADVAKVQGMSSEKPKKKGKEETDVLQMFPQECLKERDLETAKMLAKSVQEPTPSEVRRVFKRYLNQPGKVPSKLYVDMENNIVIDQDAAILTAVCSLLNLQTETTVYWHMQNANMPRSFVTVISVPKGEKRENTGKSPKEVLKMAPSVSVEYGAENTSGRDRAVAQRNRISTVLPLAPVSFHDVKPQPLVQDVHEIPVGGLYILRLNVKVDAKLKTDKWMLEIVYPELPEAQLPCRMSALVLTPNASVKSSAVANRQSFVVTVGAGGVSELLLLGDCVCIPESVIAYPLINQK